MNISVTYFMYLYCLDIEQGKHRWMKSQTISPVNTEVN